MEVEVLVMNDLKNIIREIIDEYELDYGEADIYLNNTFKKQFTIEAPNHWMTTVTIPEDDLDFYANPNVEKSNKKRCLLEEIGHACIACNPEEEFRKIWHSNTPISPFYLAECLRADKQFFMKMAVFAY